jgi:DUF2937 family protein
MRRTLAMIGGLAVGLCFSQFPEYAQQYEQRLGGAVDELKTIVDDFDRDATRFGLTRQQALERYAVSPDDFLVTRGTSMDRALARYQKLSGMLADLQHAGPLERVTHLGDYLDSDVGARAMQNFKPAVPVTPEGIGWGLFGWLIGYLLLYPVLGLFSLPFRWRRGKTPHRRAQLWRRAEPEILVVEAITEPGPRARPEPSMAAEPVMIVAEARPTTATGPARAETQREADLRIVREI